MCIFRSRTDFISLLNLFLLSFLLLFLPFFLLWRPFQKSLRFCRFTLSNRIGVRFDQSPDNHWTKKITRIMKSNCINSVRSFHCSKPDDFILICETVNVISQRSDKNLWTLASTAVGLQSQTVLRCPWTDELGIVSRCVSTHFYHSTRRL